MLTRKHNHLSVLPHLTTWTHENHGNNVYQVLLMDKGIGPAFIKELVISVDGTIINGEGLEPILKALKIIFPDYQYKSDQAYVTDISHYELILFSIFCHSKFELGRLKLPPLVFDIAIDNIRHAEQVKYVAMKFRKPINRR